jgi:hypothetical protein
MSKTYKPGQTAPRSGQYEIIGPRGGHTGEERTVTRGEPLPPTPGAGMSFELVDPTRH